MLCRMTLELADMMYCLTVVENICFTNLPLSKTDEILD